MTQVTKDQIRDALTTLDHWRECRRNFGNTQNRTEYDQAALDVCTGHAETIRTILQSALDAGSDVERCIGCGSEECRGECAHG